MKREFNHWFKKSFLCIFIITAFMAQPVAGEDVILDFRDADMLKVVEMVSRVTGKNFVVSPQVRGKKITMVAPHPMNSESVYETFLSVLKVNGLAAVPTGTVIKIIAAQQAKQSAPTAKLTDGDGDEGGFEIIRLNHVSAARLIPVLRPLIGPDGHVAAHDSSNNIIINASGADMKRFKKIISRMDRPLLPEIETIRVEHTLASEIVDMLKALSDSKKQSVAATNLNIFADDRTNTVFVSGNETQRLHIRALVTHLDMPLEHDGNTHVIYLKYAKAKDIKEILDGMVNNRKSVRSKKGDKGFENNVTILADDNTNALIITANPTSLREIKSIINKLDIRRAQVLVEAIIVEISDEDARKFGIQWLAASSEFVDLSSDNGVQLPSMLDLGTFVGKISSGRLNFGGLLKLIASEGSANIISTPSLITLDNEEAVISVGKKVPFETGSYTNMGNRADPFRTVQREGVGLTLKILPQINEGDAIKLDIEQEISNLLPNTEASFGQNMGAITSSREIKTKVIVDDGGILVLGGLIDDIVRESMVRVPLLSSIPILGQLFKYRETTKEKRNLMIFIRPRIIRDAATSRMVTHKKYNYLRNLQLQHRNRGVALMPGVDAPVLEDINTLLLDDIEPLGR